MFDVEQTTCTSVINEHDITNVSAHTEDVPVPTVDNTDRRCCECGAEYKTQRLTDNDVTAMCVYVACAAREIAEKKLTSSDGELIDYCTAIYISVCCSACLIN